MTIHQFTVTVQTPDNLSAEAVREHLLRLIDIGQDDAIDAKTEDDLSDELRADAQQAANLNILVHIGA